MKTFFGKHFFGVKMFFFVNISFCWLKRIVYFQILPESVWISKLQQNSLILVQIQCLQDSHLHIVFIWQLQKKEKKVRDRCSVEVRVVAVQAGSAKMAFPLWASCLVTRESALLAMETKFHLGVDSGQGSTQIIPYPAGVTLPMLDNLTQAW